MPLMISKLESSKLQQVPSRHSCMFQMQVELPLGEMPAHMIMIGVAAAL